VSGTKALSEGTQKLAQSVPALKEGMGQLVSGADALTGNSAALKEGAAKLTNGAGQLNDGIGKLDGGAHALNDGLKEFDKKAVKKIADAYHGDVKDLSERIKAVISAGEDYRTFAGAADDMEATTKFIIRTDGIQVEEE
jgi:putative membrane protein